MKNPNQRENAGTCVHSRVRKGYYLGLDTEDYVCVVCGKTGPGPDWPKRHEDERAELGADVIPNGALH